MHDLHTKTAENRWRQVLHEVGDEYGRREEPHVEARGRADFASHESVLMNSPFGHLERISVFVTREMTTDDIVGLAFLALDVVAAEAWTCAKTNSKRGCVRVWQSFRRTDASPNSQR